MLILKARVRSVRDEERDAQDLWRCLEIAAADGVTPEVVDTEDAADLRDLLQREFGPGGASLGAITHGLQDDAVCTLQNPDPLSARRCDRRRVNEDSRSGTRTFVQDRAMEDQPVVGGNWVLSCIAYGRAAIVRASSRSTSVVAVLPSSQA